MRISISLPLLDVRLLPDSLRASVEAFPPRPPVLGRPPRDGRALFFLVGDFGGILLMISLKSQVDLEAMVKEMDSNWRRRTGCLVLKSVLARAVHEKSRVEARQHSNVAGRQQLRLCRR